MDLFVYGTLMVPQVMYAVCGLDRPGQPAVLDGYRRRLIRGELYPGILACRGEHVDGVLYRALAPRQLALLDAFEGGMYRRTAVSVRCGGTVLTADAYVVGDDFAGMLSDSAWSLDDFLRDGLDRFIAAYPGFFAVAAQGGPDDA